MHRILDETKSAVNEFRGEFDMAREAALQLPARDVDRIMHLLELTAVLRIARGVRS